MVPQRPDAASVATLRAVTYRISNTPTQELPQVAPQIAATLWSCRDLLSLPVDSKVHGDVSVLVHRFNTQISSLLQGRSVAGRWAAVVVTKAAIEAGGHEVLSRCNAWVRSLLGILKKPDPHSTRRLATITLTRIFVLTGAYPNLVREISTPALPSFISTCLNNIETRRCSAGELQTVLDAFNTLIARHTTIFRTYETAIRSSLSRILSATPSVAEIGVYHTASHQSSACRLLTLLHLCAPKQGAGVKWDDTLNNVVAAAHVVCDRIFRPVKEEWESTTSVEPSLPLNERLNGEAKLESSDGIGLVPWQGLDAGRERLEVLLALLQSHLENPTGTTISFRVGKVVDLLHRLFSIKVPRPGHPEHMKANREFSDEERDMLFSTMPKIHSAAIDTCRVLVERFSSVTVPLQKILLENMISAFPAGQAQLIIRLSTYTGCDTIIKLIGPTMTQHDLADLGMVLRAACADLLPETVPGATDMGLLNGSTSLSKPGSNLMNSQDSALYVSVPETVRDAAARLVQTTLEKVSATCLTAKLRAQIDRTAIMLQDRDLLLASVMNPPVKPSDGRSRPSLLPFLARGYPQDREVESLLRPRFPPIRADGQSSSATSDNSYNDYEDISNADDERPEPMSGLPNALAQESESSTVLPASIAAEHNLSLVTDQPLTSKRPAAPDFDSESSPKRTRSSVIVEQSTPITDSLLSALDTTIVQTDTSTVGSAKVAEKPHDNAPPPAGVESQTPISAPMSARLHKDSDLGDDNDSDIGTPPLEMKTDSEDDDDEEEEEEEEDVEEDEAR